MSSPEMTELSDGTSHCQHCNKTVHNLSGWNLMRVIEFVKLNPGSCITLREKFEANKAHDK